MHRLFIFTVKLIIYVTLADHNFMDIRLTGKGLDAYMQLLTTEIR